MTTKTGINAMTVALVPHKIPQFTRIKVVRPLDFIGLGEKEKKIYKVLSERGVPGKIEELAVELAKVL